MKATKTATMRTMNKSIQILGLLLAMCTASSLTSCNEGDDIDDIFLNRTWKLAFFREGNITTGAKEGYEIRFYENSFTATTPGGATISGNWHADNKERTFNCTQVRVISGSIAGDTTATKMRTFLEKATAYKGDTNYLQIIQQSNILMQFYNR
ncbi:MAG: hypothetical protein IJN24_03770 [Bacteroidaceae bacterium]|nr:hypothetical protein [Bacteroidaceae bacterium]